ncbi:MAG: YjbH domain-containing protein [Cytophagales bacterium]|nr:YjbH domain-containing protein [Cytophagales bacterium]
MLFLLTSFGQRNLSGKSGLMYIPDASSGTDGLLSSGYLFNPINYSLRRSKRNSERVLFANLSLMPRLEITFLLLHPLVNGRPKKRYGIGDRQLDIRYQLFYEKEYMPAVIIGFSSPFTTDAAIESNMVVATKSFKRNRLDFSGTLGFGSPYYLYRNEKNLNNSNVLSNFSLQKKSNDLYGNEYLVGLFGGVKVAYKERIHLMIEWDGQKFNSGLHVRFFKKFHIQGGVLNFDQYMFGFYLEQSLTK